MNYDDYAYLSTDEILKAVKGDSDALEVVMTRYENYAKQCLYGIACDMFNLEPQSLPIEDLMQEIWMKLVPLITERFACGFGPESEET